MEKTVTIKTHRLQLLAVGAVCLVFILVSLFYFVRYSDLNRRVDSLSDQKAASISERAIGEAEQELAEREKQPYKQFFTTEVNSSVYFDIPKTWSWYHLEETEGASSVDSYMYPVMVPDVGSDTPMALRFKMDSTEFDLYISDRDDLLLEGVTTKRSMVIQGKEAFLFEGVIVKERKEEKTGRMLVFKVRDKTVRLWTESEDYYGDFDRAVESLGFRN